MRKHIVAASMPLLACIAILFAAALALLPIPGQFAAAAAPDHKPASRKIARPKASSLEYRLSWGLGAIHADRAYARGVNGNGITVALIDTGIAGAPAGLFGQVSPASTDLIARRQRPLSNASHGEHTAGLIAARLDGSRTVGVAYGATLLAIRADIDGSCDTMCAVRGSDLARGIDYAVAHGARIIGLPLIGGNRLRSVEPALARAAAAGAVIVAAAGNSGSQGPSWPALYAADPRFAGSMIVAGASTPSGELARWSATASATKARYIAAPGENVIVGCDEKFCRLVSGTSYSVAYVAGALSLILEAHPQLSPAQAAALLLAAAADRGPRGIDPESGTGVLDVGRALRLAKRQLS